MPSISPQSMSLDWCQDRGNKSYTFHYGYEKGTGTSYGSIGKDVKGRYWNNHTAFFAQDYTIDITSGQPRIALMIVGHSQNGRCAPNDEPYAGLYRYLNPVQITYNLNGGQVGTSTTKTEYLFSGDTLATTFNAPTKDGAVFLGWYTSSSGGSRLTASNSSTATTYYAHWLTLSYDQKPQAKVLTYNGQEQELVTGPGQATNGYTVKYSLDGQNWSTSIPKGTNAGNYTVKVKYEGSNGNPTFSGDSIPVTIKKSAATVKADDQTKTYGDADPELTATVTGLQGSDTAAVLTYTVSRDDSQNVGEHTITASGAAEQGNYIVTYKTGKLTIGQRTVTNPTITLGRASYPYDADSDASPRVTVLDDLGNKIPDSEYTVAYQNNRNPRDKTDANPPTATVADVDGGNYNIQFNPAEKASVTFTITPGQSYLQKVPTAKRGLEYNGTEQELIDAGEGAHGTVKYRIGTQGDWSTSVPKGKRADSYEVYYMVEGDENYNNWTGTDGNGQKLTVTIAKKPVTVTAKDQSITYGGDIALGTDQVTPEGLVTGDALSNVTLTASTTEVTTSGTITASGVQVKNGATDVTDNYTITCKTGVLTINPASAPSSAAGWEGTYDGQPHGITVTVEDTFDNQPQPVVWYGAQQLTAANYKNDGFTSLTYTDAGTYTVYYYVESDNYAVNPVNGSATVTIHRAAATVTANNAEKSCGEADPAFTATVTGLVNNENADDVLSYGFQRQTGEAQGTYRIAPVGEAEQGNYAVTYVPGTLTITRGTISPKVTLDGWTYGDAANEPVVTGNTGNGAVTYTYYTDEDCSVPTTTASGAQKQGRQPAFAGTYYVKADVAATSTTQGGSAKASFTIAKAEIAPEVTIDGWTYGGTANTPSVTGNPGDGAVSYRYYTDQKCTILTTPTDNGADNQGGQPTCAGTYYVQATVEETANYKGGTASAAFTVARAEVTVTAGDCTKVYGDNDPELTWTVSGLLNGDTADVLTVNAFRKTGENVGSYPITVTGNDIQGNYKVNYTPGTLTITQAGAQLVANDYSGVYDGKPHSIEVKVKRSPQDVILGRNEATVYYSRTALNEHNYNTVGSTDAPGCINVGTYTVYYYVECANYGPVEVSGSKTVTITPKSVTITGLAACDKVYDGKTDATVTGTAAIDGKVDGDEVTVTAGTASFADAKAGTDKTVTFDGYGISGAKADNYQLSAQPADVKASITPKPVTITGLGAENKVYDGTTAATAAAAATAEISGKVGSDVVEVTAGSAAFADKNVGTGKTVTFTGYGLSGTDAGNYTLSAQPAEAQADITPATLTVTADDLSKVYGKADPTKFTYTVTGLMSGDSITGALERETGENVGTYTIQQGTLSAGDNYSIAFNEGTFTITKDGATVTASSYSGTYDGQPHSISVTTKQGLLDLLTGNSPEATVYYSETRELTAENYSTEGSTVNPTYTDVGENTVYYFVKCGNYDAQPISGSKTVTITPKSVTITGLSAKDKTYDGNEKATITGYAELNGKVGDDAVAIIPGTAVFEDKSAGLNRAVTFSGYSLTGEKAGNYSLLSQPEDVSANITPKPITIRGLSAENKPYDGDTHATVTGTPVLDGLVNGDNVGVSAGTAVFADRKAGTGKQVSFTGFTLTGADVGNYTLTGQPESVEADILPREVTLEWSDTSFTYDGKSHAPTATATGLVEGEACTVTVTGEETDAGSYTATAAELSNPNYKLPQNVTQDFTIEQKEVGLEWSDTTFTYDGQPHLPTATATGLVEGDECTVTVTGEETDAGSYTATAAELSNPNYKLPAATTQSFTIEQMEAGLKWFNTSFTYDGKSHVPTATATGLADGDKCEVTVTGAQTNAGSYTATAAKLSNSNYKLPGNVTQKFTVVQKEVGLKWSNTSFPYNGKSHLPTATATGLVKGDECTVTVTGEETNAGSYTATAAELSNANYKLPQNVTQSFTINKADQTAPAAPAFSAATTNSITVKAVAGQEYSIDGGKTWQKSGTFKGLKVNTSYKIVARKTGDRNHNDSPASKSASVRTKDTAAHDLNKGLKVTQTGNKLNASWGKVDDATSYEVWVQYCGIKFRSKPTMVLEANQKRNISITKLNGKWLNLARNVRVKIVAKKGKKTLGASITAHVVGRKNKYYTNAKGIDLTTKSFELKKGKKAQIKAKTVLVYPERKLLSNVHAREFRYDSSDPSVATVSKSGRITAKGKGKCVVYVYARNGFVQKVNVTVK